MDLSFAGKEAGHGPLVSIAGLDSGRCGVVMYGANGGGNGGCLVHTFPSVARDIFWWTILVESWKRSLEPISPH